MLVSWGAQPSPPFHTAADLLHHTSLVTSQKELGVEGTDLCLVIFGMAGVPGG